MYVLDTNVVSELRKVKSGRADPGLATWAASVPASALFLSVVTLLELELGVLLSERRDRVQGATLRVWFEAQVLPAFADRILPIDTSIARRCAPDYMSLIGKANGTLIAATALVHGMSVVTRNVADFAATGVSLVNPWRP